MASSQGNPIVLNIHETTSSKSPTSLETLIGDLRKSILNLKAEFIADDGSTVDYEGMSKSPTFEAYKVLASSLQFVNIEKLKESNEAERKAFFINLYNVQMIHSLVAQSSLPESPLKIQGMWSSFAYNVGGLLFTLDEIEHGVLRCNQGHPKDNIPMFNDAPRQSLAMSTLDPRIHFALNCGARSCPPIRIYQGSKLDHQLDVAARSFVNQDIEIEAEQMVILSKLLLWYKKDFGQTDAQVLEKLASFVTDEDLKAKLQVIIDNGKDEKIKFRDYDWQLNSK